MEAFTEADILVIRVASAMGHIDALSIRNVLLKLLRMQHYWLYNIPGTGLQLGPMLLDELHALIQRNLGEDLLLDPW